MKTTIKIFTLILLIGVLLSDRATAQTYTPDIQIGQMAVEGVGHSAPQTSFVLAVDARLNKLFQSGYKQCAVGGEETLMAQIQLTKKYADVERNKNARYRDGTVDNVRIVVREFAGYDIAVKMFGREGQLLGALELYASPQLLQDGSVENVAWKIFGTGLAHVERLRKAKEVAEKQARAKKSVSRKGGKP